MKILIMAICLFFVVLFLGGCASNKFTNQPKTVILNIDSEIPVVVSVYKSCKGNWNFCDDYRNYNFQKWE